MRGVSQHGSATAIARFKSGKHRIMLEGYAYRWYRIGGLDYLLRRTDIDQKDIGAK
jgi:maltose alpha-D-glucosyltransferase / alpha-amylase